jgi:hypothetical protein
MNAHASLTRVTSIPLYISKLAIWCSSFVHVLNCERLVGLDRRARRQAKSAPPLRSGPWDHALSVMLLLLFRTQKSTGSMPSSMLSYCKITRGRPRRSASGLIARPGRTVPSFAPTRIEIVSGNPAASPLGFVKSAAHRLLGPEAASLRDTLYRQHCF